MYSGIWGKDQPEHEEYLQYFDDSFDSGCDKVEPIFTRCVVESALRYRGCGKARPGSTTVEWRWSGLLKKLVDNLSRYSTRKEHMTTLSKICQKHG